MTSAELKLTSEDRELLESVYQKFFPHSHAGSFYSTPQTAIDYTQSIGTSAERTAMRCHIEKYQQK